MLYLKDILLSNKSIYLIIVCITVVLSVGIYSFSNYKKEELKQQEENNRFNAQQEKITGQQNLLKYCIEQAKATRTDLWESNCPDNNPNCSLSPNTVQWIDSRYQQELDSCYELYGN